MALHGWKSNKDGQTILVGERVIAGLRTLAIDGLMALPRRGIEVGGLLVGKAADREIEVEGFEEVPCEHRYGPSYALSDSDRQALSKLLAQRTGGPLPVIGFFRSFTYRDPALEQADEAFVSENFPQGDFVFLMLQPRTHEDCVASLRTFHDGQLLPDTEEEPFVFDAAAMPVMEPTPPFAPPPEAPPETAPRDRLVEAAPLVHQRARYLIDADLPPEPARSSRARSWMLPAACALAVGAGIFGFQQWRAARQPRWTELHLDARPVNSQLEVTWDGFAPRALNATNGLLAVTDGGAHQDIALNSEQIRGGKYTLMPAHPDVALRLILYDKGTGVSGDSVRISQIPQVPEAPAPAKASAHADAPLPPAAARSVPETAPASAAPLVATHEVQPHLPPGIRSRLHETVDIPVRVEVSPQGRVVRAAALSKDQDSIHRYLDDAARKAARQWRFRPSRGTTHQTLHFVFTP